MRSILIVSLASLVVLVNAHSEWDLFKARHAKKYETALEDSMRMGIFLENKEMIDRFNMFEASRAGYELAINHLSDWTKEELDKLNGARVPNETPRNSPEAEAFFQKLMKSSDEVPESVDWRKVKGRVSEVQDQGPCGSCWAFSAVGALEGQMEARNTSFQVLSTQNLLDCSELNGGCDGGWMWTAWKDVAKEGGIEQDSDYEYVAERHNCSFLKSKAVFSDKSFYILPKGDENTLKETVAKFGPVSVAFDVSNTKFRYYRRGVYYEKSCVKDNPVHALLVVGYGSDPEGGDYWIVKNYWSKIWGDEGYILMARNRDNFCGIASHAMIPTF